MKKVLALIGLCLTVGGCQLPVVQVVSVKESTLRETPSACAREVARIPFGTEVEVLGYVDTKIYGDKVFTPWGKVSCNGREGYLPAQSILIMSHWTKQKRSVNEQDYALAVALRRFIDDESNLESSALRGAFASAKLKAEHAVKTMEEVLANHPPVDPAAVSEFKSEGLLTNRWTPALEPHDISDAYDLQARLFVPFEYANYYYYKLLDGLGASNRETEAKAHSSWKNLALSLTKDQLARMNAPDGPLEEYGLAKGLLSRLLSDHKVLPAGDARSRYVENVSCVLLTESVSPEAYDGLRVFLVEDAEPNAVSLSGGMLAVTTGMLGFVRDEDELAAILAHEIAHEELSHGAKSVRAERAKWSVFSLVTDVGSALEFESEADLRALTLLASAGYDPRALHDVIERFKEQRQTYGGATYPEERGRLVAEAIVRDGLPTGECGRAQRTKRFNEITRGAK